MRAARIVIALLMVGSIVVVAFGQCSRLQL